MRMGAWGTGIWEDDLSCDVQDEWNELLDDGETPKKATKIILDSWLNEFEDYDDEEDAQAGLSLLYIALATLQIRHQALDKKIKKKTLEYLEKGADLHLWEDNKEDLGERKEVLDKFKEKLLAIKP